MNTFQDKWVFKMKATGNFSKDQKKNDWQSSFNTVCAFQDVDSFWKLYFNVLGSKLGIYNQNNLIYTVHSMFKENIEPVWEDPKNANGSSIHFFVSENAKEFGETVAILCVGNEIKGINGVTFDVKPPRGNNKISLWKISIWLDNSTKKSKDEVIAYMNKYLPKEQLQNFRIDNHSY